MERVLIFANPIAGRGRGQRIALALERAFTQAGFDAPVFLERAEDVAIESLRPDDAPAAVISIGGDGTLRAVTQRLFDTFPRDAIPPTLVVPLGTANLMSKHLAADWRGPHPERRIVAAIQHRKITLIDTATANGKIFLLMAGIGIDAQIVHELDRLRDGPIDITSYALPAALALQSFSYSNVEVETEAGRLFGPGPALVFVGNVPEYGTGFPVLPLARSDDGVLDLCVLPCASRVDLIRWLLDVAGGDHVRAETSIYATARHIIVKSDPPLPVQIDGEAAGHTPLEIRMLDDRLPFIVPS